MSCHACIRRCTGALPASLMFHIQYHAHHPIPSLHPTHTIHPYPHTMPSIPIIAFTYDAHYHYPAHNICHIPFRLSLSFSHNSSHTMPSNIIPIKTFINHHIHAIHPYPFHFFHHISCDLSLSFSHHSSHTTVCRLS